MKFGKKLKKIRKLKKELKSIKSNLLKLADDKEPLVRSDAIDAFVYFYDGDIDRKILKRLKDRDNLVKISALDAIILPQNIDKVFKKIAKNLDSKDFLVRAYAIDALGFNGAKRYKKRIKKFLKSKERDEVLVRVYYALVKFGDKQYLNNLFDMLNHKSYIIRLATAKYLYYLSDKRNYRVILKKLKEAIKKEDTKSVKHSLKKAIKKISKECG